MVAGGWSLVPVLLFDPQPAAATPSTATQASAANRCTTLLPVMCLSRFNSSSFGNVFLGGRLPDEWEQPPRDSTAIHLVVLAPREHTIFHLRAPDVAGGHRHDHEDVPHGDALQHIANLHQQVRPVDGMADDGVRA